MNKYYKAKIIEVSSGSIAEKFGIEPDDLLISIDDKPIRDLLDYQFAIYDTSSLTLSIEKKTGELKEIFITKAPNDELGLTFDSAVFDKLKLCNNKCIFCFVDQQPSGLRESLYIKDDDYRLSYLQGTYVTLTNLTKKDIERISSLRLGPLYISVHTTNPELRIKMLQNKLAGDIMDKLRWLEELFIPIHTQIVLCPGFNDGKEFEKTLNDLSSLEIVESIAVVPVGITVYRQESSLKPFDKEKAVETLEIINRFKEKTNYNFIYPADELYLLADFDIPTTDFYNGFPQLENGIGSIRYTFEKFDKLKIPERINKFKKIGIITSRLGAKALSLIFNKLSRIDNLELKIIPIESQFWGEHISVCGLISGKDIMNQLTEINDLPDELFISDVMLRKFSNEFLDSITVKEVEDKFNIKISVLNNNLAFQDLVEKIF